MFLKDLVIRFFPRLYTWKNFSLLDKSNFKNYKENEIEPELLLLPFLLNREKAFVDVGSNKGIFLYAGSKLLSASKIFAFEPNPVLFKKIKNVFKQVNAFNLALSSEKGEAVLTIPFTQGQPDDSLANIQNGELLQNAFNFKVEVNTIDNCSVEWRDIKTGFIKIDVEGHELEVIRGAESVIKNDKPILLVEIEQRHHQEDIKEIIGDFCDRFDYQAYYFLPAKDKLVGFSEEPVIYQDKSDFGTIHYVNNFFFISKSEMPDALVASINSEIEKIRRK